MKDGSKRVMTVEGESTKEVSQRKHMQEKEGE